MAQWLIDTLRAHATRRPDACAIRAVGRPAESSLSFSQLERRTSQVAASLREHTPEGAAVLLCQPNRPGFHPAFLGTLAAGRTVFPIAADSTAAELESAMRRAAVVAAIVPADRLPLVAPMFRASAPLSALGPDVILLTQPLAWPARKGGGPALLLQSSGTTDRPKIVRRDGASLDAVARAMVNACGFTANDHVLAAVPLCHSYGMEHGLLAPVAAGACIHLGETFDVNAVLAELRDGGVTMLPGVPFMFDMLGRAAEAQFPSLRRAYSAGGPLPRATFDAFLAKTGLRIGQVYGATEIGSVTFNDPASPDFDRTSVGVPMEGVRIHIVDSTFSRQACLPATLDARSEGQVAIRADSMMSGYLDSDDAPIVEGYYLTGDLGRVDARGALTITGRLKLLIDVGGRKVNPAEVEAVLRQHPDVGACIVLPIPVSENVSRLKAIVAPTRAGASPTPDALRAFARERLSPHKVPRVIEIRDSLPTSASGKVIRHAVEAP